MKEKRLFNICKNIIAITLSIAMLIFFGYSDNVMTQARAQDGTGEAGAESELELGTEALEETTETAEEIGADVTNNSGDNTGNSDNLENMDSDVIDDSDVGKEDEETLDVTPYAMEEELTVVATISYEYPDPDYVLDEVLAETEVEAENKTEEEVGGEEKLTQEIPLISETKEYYTLQDAFSGAKEVAKLMLDEHEIADYTATVKLVEDVACDDVVINEDNASFTLDLNGHYIVLAETAYIDFAQGNVTFIDSGYALGGTLGGVSGVGEFLFTSAGSITFTNGYFENLGDKTAKSIVANAVSVTVEAGYYIAADGSIVTSTETAIVNGGFFIYNYKLGFAVTGNVVLPDEMALVKSQILLGDVSMTGYELGTPNYMVTISVATDDEAGSKQISAYYASFVEAWDQAAQLSVENMSAIATISIYNPEISGVSVSQMYTMNYSGEGSCPVVSISGIDFARDGAYDGGMFTVNGGKLIFDGCELNGVMEEANMAQGSIVTVNGTGNATLIDTTVTNNCSISEGAGVYVSSGTTLGIIGATKVSSNSLYTFATDDEPGGVSPSNVYLEEDAMVVILGELTSPEASIGIKHSDGTIAGLTMFGKLDSGFLADRKAGLQPGEELDISDVTKVIVSDSHPSYYLVYNVDENTLIWDKEKAYLPEAGVIKFEFVILILALAGFIFRNSKVVKESKGLNIYVTTLSVICLISGGALGFYHVGLEKEAVIKNESVITDMTAADMNNVVESKVVTAKADMEIETEAVEKAKSGLDVPKDGRDYYGILEIEELGIRLPVLADYSDANMKTTPCVYYGDANDYNLVIVGHNYDSQLAAFNELDDEQLNVKLYLMDGSEFDYESFAIEYLNPDQVDEMLMGEWDMTVFTCNYAGDKRIALRCNLTK